MFSPEVSYGVLSSAWMHPGEWMSWRVPDHMQVCTIISRGLVRRNSMGLLLRGTLGTYSQIARHSVFYIT